MVNGISKSLLEQIQRQLDLPASLEQALGGNNALASLERALGGNNALARLVEDMNHRKGILSAAYGPMEELRRSGVVAALTQQVGGNRWLQEELKAATGRFSLPEIAQATGLLESYRTNHASEIVKQLQGQQDYLRSATEAMRSPWLNMTDQMRSIGAFADLQSIGFALQKIPSFDDRLTELLRVSLGDWQHQITWPEAILNDPLARSAFYAERGLDPALTAFPAEAFAQSLDIAGLRSPLPPRIGLYDHEEAGEDDEEEATFVRTNAAHDRLQRFETHVRNFIVEQMMKAFGEQWIKQRVPGDIRQSWIDKREKARANGEPEHPLIAYADFTDYVPIIIRKDNWNEIFAPFFDRQTSVQESFQRLYPIRICTMHARMITQDDELYLHVETKRVLSAIVI